MRYFLGLTAGIAMLVASAAGQTAASAKKKPIPSTARKSAVRRPSTTIHSGAPAVRRPTSGASASHKKAAPVKAVTWRNRQLAPSPDRYREIQQALVSKGYLQAEQATGTWDQNSTDALKRFQAAQSLDPSGKINSLSLIALGLGPRHDAPPAQIAAPEELGR
jgi:Putative peptidoglycan binding domain